MPVTGLEPYMPLRDPVFQGRLRININQVGYKPFAAGAIINIIFV